MGMAEQAHPDLGRIPERPGRTGKREVGRSNIGRVHGKMDRVSAPTRRTDTNRCNRAIGASHAPPFHPAAPEAVHDAWPRLESVRCPYDAGVTNPENCVKNTPNPALPSVKRALSALPRGRTPDLEMEVDSLLDGLEVLFDYTAPVPGFLYERVTSKNPFTTSDIRKMWPHLQRQLRLPADRKRPMGESEIAAFILEVMRLPGAGLIMESCSFEAGAMKTFRGFSYNRQEQKLSLMWESPAEDSAARSDQLATAIFLALWVLGVAPKPESQANVLALFPDSTRIREVLDYANAIRDRAAPASTKPATEASAVETPNSVQPDSMFGILHEVATSTLARLAGVSPSSEFESLADCIRVMQQVAETIRAEGRADLAGQINALINQIQEWIHLVNAKASKSVIAPLSIDAIPPNDPRASDALYEAARHSVATGSEVPAALDTRETARKAVAESLSDEDMKLAREAVQLYDQAVQRFSQSIDPMRPLLAEAAPVPTLPAVVLPESVKALIARQTGLRVDSPSPTPSQSPAPEPEAPPASTPEPSSPNSPSAQKREVESAVEENPTPAAPAAPSPAKAKKRVESSPKSDAPSPPAVEADNEIAASSVATVDVPQVPDPALEAPEAAPSRAIAAIQKLISRNAPGLALTLARLFEDAYLEELPGGPAFHALLCAAAAGSTIEPVRYDALDRHFEALIQQIVAATDSEVAEAQAMAYLAAVINPALFVRNASATYHLSVIQGALGSPALEHLARLLEEPVQQRIDATPETLRRAAGNADHIREQRAAQHRMRARQIIDNLDGETRHDFSSHQNSLQTWRFIRAKEHPFGAALHAIAAGEDDKSLTAKLRIAQEHYSLGPDDALDAAYSKFANDRLISANRRRLLSAMENLDTFFRLVSDHRQPINKDEGARLAVFANRLANGLSSAIAETQASPHAGIRGLAQSVLLKVMTSTLELLDASDLARPQGSLEDRLHRDLLITDLDLGVEINGATTSGKSAYSLSREYVLHGDPAALAERLLSHDPAPFSVDALAEACQRHFESGRVISGMVALTTIRIEAPDHPRLAELEEIYETARIAARHELLEKATKAKRVVARASFSTLLPPAEIARMEASIERVMELAKSLPVEGAVSGPLSNDSPRDFIQAKQFLDVAILEPVERKQSAALAQFQARVEEERGQLKDPAPNAVQRVLTLAEQGQIVSAEEFWAQLRGGHELPTLQAGNEPLRVFHREFMPALIKAGKLARVVEELQSSVKEGRADFFGQPLERGVANETRLLVEAWQQATAGQSTSLGRLVAAFFERLLGREAASTTPAQIHGQVVFVDVTDVDFRKTIGNEAFVVPRIGSGAGGQFRVAVPTRNATVIGVREAMAHNPDIILTRARLSLDDRRRLYSEIRDSAASSGRGCLIIDDALLAFAAASPHSAASRIVSVASTFLYTQPYKVEDATSPEMFFGRRDAERQILESTSALIYGGRRLGKTSLISEICRKYTSRAAKKFFVHVELKAGLEAGNYASTVWESIGKALVEDKVLQSTGIQFNIGNGSAVINAIKKAFQENKISQLTLYLDEADVFMKYEEKNQFAVLYEIHNELAMRYPEFRYAISGLNNVQRISLGWNTRLGRIGKPVAITPFIGDERHAGLRLICEPLAALGFEFEGEDLPLQILSAASFYPALIQAYCSYLLDNLYRRPVRGEPPFLITQKDLIETESNEKLIKDMLDIFNYTVSLDPRYTAICGILAESQASSERVGDTAVPLSALTDRAVTVAPNLFPKGNPTVIVEAAAEALINLGILVRLPNTQLYQFRSPRILSRLRELPQVRDFLANPDVANAFPELDPSEARPKFADGSLCPIPLRMVNSICAPAREQESVRMLASSPATGHGLLRKLATDTQWALGRTLTRQGSADTETALTVLMDKLVQDRSTTSRDAKLTLKRATNERELFVVTGNWLPSAPSRLEGIDSRIRDQHRSVLLVCEPDRVWQIASKVSARMAFLPLWTVPALRLHLQNEELTDFQGESTLSLLQNLTGGCSTLVEAACAHLHQHHKLPSHKDLMSLAGVRSTLRDTCQFFGIRPEHDPVIQQVAAVSRPRAEFEELLSSGGMGTDASRLFTYLEWMGALVVDQQGRWSLNPVLDAALVELA